MSDENRIYYVYSLLDPRYGNVPFYIGMGHGDRFQDHFKEKAYQSTNARRRRVILDCRRKKLEIPVKMIKENLNQAEAYELEKKTIQTFGRRGYDKGGILTNIRIGH